MGNISVVSKKVKVVAMLLINQKIPNYLELQFKCRILTCVRNSVCHKEQSSGSKWEQKMNSDINNNIELNIELKGS